MKRNNMKSSRLAIILSLLAIVGVLSLLSLWAFRNLRVSILSLDTFVGVIVALLAIIVTIILGWQIVNALELRGKMTELEQRQVSMLNMIQGLTENNQNLVKLASNLQAGQSGTDAELYLMKRHMAEAFASAHSALHQAINAGQAGLSGRVAHLQSLCFQITVPPVADFQLIKKQLEAEYQDIKESKAYPECVSAGYENVMQLFWAKMQLFGLMSS